MMKLQKQDEKTRLPLRATPAVIVGFTMLMLSQQTNSNGFAQSVPSPSPAPAALPPEPASLAEGNYADRQRATLEMWRKRSSSRQAVQDAARNPDPEVAERAEWILRQWRNGAVPGMGGPVTGLNGNQRSDSDNSNSAIASVLEAGLFDAAIVAVEESAGTIEYEQIRSRIEQLIIERYPFYVDRALESGGEPSLLRLLHAVASDRRLAQTAHDLKRQLGLPVAPKDWLPASSSQWEKSESQAALSQIAVSSGQMNKAIEFARQAEDPELLRAVMMQDQRWSEIAEEAYAALEEEVGDWKDVESFQSAMTRLSAALSAASRLNDAERVQGIVAKLIQETPWDSSDNPVAGLANGLRWRTLLVHNHVDEAIDVLTRIDRSKAAEIATSASRYERAFELCGFTREKISTELDAWIIQAYRSQSKLPAGQIAPEISNLYALARLLLYCGDTDNPFRIYSALDAQEIIVDQRNTTLRDRTLFEIARVGRLEWLVDLAVLEGENRVAPRTFGIVTRMLDSDYQSFGRVLERIKKLLPASSFRDRFRATCDLFRGIVPEGMDPEKDFERLYELLVHNPKIDRRGGRLKQIEVVLLDMKMVEMFQNHGQFSLVRKGLNLLAGAGNREALLQLAENELEHGSQELATRLWDRLLALSSQFTPTEAMITIDHGQSYAQAIVGQWIVAKRAGHREAAVELEKRLRFMATSPSFKFRHGLAGYLGEMGQFSFAAEILRDLVVVAGLSSQEEPDFYDIAASYTAAVERLAESDPGEVDRLGIQLSDSPLWNDLVLLSILASDTITDSYYVSLAVSVRKSFLEQAVEQTDQRWAERLVSEIENLDPLDIDFAERLLPQLRDAGMVSVADAALRRLLEQGKRHAKQFGLDATTLNNLAWTAAMNHLQLDDALLLSEQAVFLEPDSVVYRDTLAEVLFLLGNVEEAIEIETGCLLDQPDEWHLHEQIKKYKKAL